MLVYVVVVFPSVLLFLWLSDRSTCRNYRHHREEMDRMDREHAEEMDRIYRRYR